MKFFHILVCLMLIHRADPFSIMGQSTVQMVGMLPVKTLDADSTMSAVSNTGIPSSKAIKQYVDSGLKSHSQVNSDWNSVSGLSLILHKPTIPTLVSQLTNDAGFINGITNTMVTGALGYTPYNAANPSGFISGNQNISISGDATGSGTTGIALTLSTVNATPGTFGSSTVGMSAAFNSKGLMTGLTTVNITPAFSSITSTPTTLAGYGITDGVTSTFAASNYVSLSGTYTNPSWIVSVPSSKVTGLSTVATTGDYNDLSNKPSIPSAQVNSDWSASSGVAQILNKPTIPTNTNQLTNGSGFITGITDIMVNTALGYTPYSTSNPSGYISSITSTNVISALGYTPLNYSFSGTAGQYTKGNGTYGTLNPVPATTTDLPEGTNLYYTDTRSRNAISVVSTNGLPAYNSTTGAITVPVQIVFTPTFNATPARALSTTGSNNTFTISATRPASVHYTINFSVSLLVAVSNGVVSLDYSIDAGTNWITAASVSQVFGVSITITTSGDQVVGGDIPAGALVRLYRSANSNVTVTAPTTKQQEVTY